MQQGVHSTPQWMYDDTDYKFMYIAGNTHDKSQSSATLNYISGHKVIETLYKKEWTVYNKNLCIKQAFIHSRTLCSLF